MDLGSNNNNADPEDWPRTLPVEIVEEGQQVEGQLDPALPLTLVERVRVHDGGGVVQPGAGHHGPVQVPAGTANRVRHWRWKSVGFRLGKKN